MSLEERASKALMLIHAYGQEDGTAHARWVIDQIARALLGPEYETWIEAWEEDGKYYWDVGIAP